MNRGTDTAEQTRYLDAMERRIDAHNLNYEIHQQIDRDLAAVRRELLSEAPPRNQCPGCFMAIHYGAAKAGWCMDCEPKRGQYEKQAYGY